MQTIFTISPAANLPQEYANRLPLVYRPEYDIDFFGLQHLHQFDSKKWGRVVSLLRDQGELFVDGVGIYEPEIVSTEDVLERHMKAEYLEAIKSSPKKIAEILELYPARWFPMSLLERLVLRPFRYQVGGTLLATQLALKHGAAINIGGGFHHASLANGEGFCVYPDISLAILEARRHYNLTGNILIVDLDAHQGNGHERDFFNDNTVTIVDFFSHPNYPGFALDHPIVKRINHAFPVDWKTSEQEYLDRLDKVLNDLSKSSYSLIVYNAGTDILQRDPLGRLSITEDAIVARDEQMFQYARENQIPIVMLTSGGYTSQSAVVIAKSITNLISKGYINKVKGPW